MGSEMCIRDSGCSDGGSDGSDGGSDGCNDGFSDGCNDGCNDGFSDGCNDGGSDGSGQRYRITSKGSSFEPQEDSLGSVSLLLMYSLLRI